MFIDSQGNLFQASVDAAIDIEIVDDKSVLTISSEVDGYSVVRKKELTNTEKVDMTIGLRLRLADIGGQIRVLLNESTQINLLIDKLEGVKEMEIQISDSSP